jgi:hypothetical protein
MIRSSCLMDIEAEAQAQAQGQEQAQAQGARAGVERARSMMRGTIRDIYAERFYCPNNVYCIIFGLLLIIISSIAINNGQNKYIMVWCAWNIIRGCDSILGMVIHHLTADSDWRICKYIRGSAELFHVMVFIVGFALAGAGILRYGFRHLPYICIFTLLVTVIDIIWLIYLLSQARHSTVLRIPSRSVTGNIYMVNHNVEYLSARTMQEPCIVCMDTSEQPLLKLHCNHIYHQDCILPWLKTKGTCPLCRDTSSVTRVPPPAPTPRATGTSFLSLSLDRHTGYQSI